MAMLFEEIRGLPQLCGAKLSNDHCHLLSGGLAAFLSVDRFQHLGDVTHLARKHHAEDVPIEVHDTALPLRVREVLSGALDQATAGIRDDQLHAR